MYSVIHDHSLSPVGSFIHTSLTHFHSLILHQPSHPCTYPHTHPLIRTPTHSRGRLIHSSTHSQTYTDTQSLAHSLSHLLIDSLTSTQTPMVTHFLTLALTHLYMLPLAYTHPHNHELAHTLTTYSFTHLFTPWHSHSLSTTPHTLTHPHTR